MAAKRYEQAYNLGQTARRQGITDMRDLVNAYWSETQYYSHTELVFTEAGLRNAQMPSIVTGWRYGHIPACGLSYNYRDDRPESGVSLMAVDGGAETADKLSALFIAAGRPVVRVRGYLHTYKVGSDGEPLVLDAVEIE